MRNLARRLIAAECRVRDVRVTEAGAALRVCEKLRVALTPLAGSRGFRSLMARALTLATVEAPSLSKLEIGSGGALSTPATLENEVDQSEAAKAGAILVTHLLEILATLIGEALTLQLVQQVWSNTAIDDPQSEGKT